MELAVNWLMAAMVAQTNAKAVAFALPPAVPCAFRATQAFGRWLPSAQSTQSGSATSLKKSSVARSGAPK